MAKKWKLSSKQSELWRLYESGCKKLGFIGAIRAGKTFLGARITAAEAYRRRNPKSNLGWIVAPTYPMSLVPERELELVLDRAAIKRRVRQERAIELQNGFRLETKTAEYPDRLRGPGLAIVWIDEASLISQHAWNIILGRVLDTDGIILVTTTPRGRNWLYEEFYLRSKTDPDYMVVQAKTEDNPTISKDEIAKLRSRYKGEFAAQELDAEFVTFSGLVFKNFDIKKHVIPPLVPKQHATVFAGIDFGFNDPFVCLWIAKQDGHYYIFDEHYYSGQTLQNHSVMIHRRCRKPERFWADPTGAQERAELQRYHVPTLSFKESSVMAGIQMVEYLLTQTLPDGKPILQVCENCTHTIEEFRMYSYAEAKEGRNPTEKPIDAFNHCMDAARGALTSEGYGEFKIAPKIPPKEEEKKPGYTPLAAEMKQRYKELTRTSRNIDEYYGDWLD